ncbi:MAG: OmpH family outer membrane protein [Gemmatimonadales bacterium]
MTRVMLAVLVCAAIPAAAQAPSPASGAQQPSLRVAFVNSREVLLRTPGYAAAESTFNRDVLAFRDEITRLRQQLDSAVRAYDQQSIALSPTAKQAKQRELQTMQDRIEQRADELQTRASDREKELLQPIQARVNGVIQGLRAEGNYAMIFDAERAGIVAADPSLDITARVIQRLQQSQ